MREMSDLERKIADRLAASAGTFLDAERAAAREAALEDAARFAQGFLFGITSPTAPPSTRITHTVGELNVLIEHLRTGALE
jgi:hypothetical protein